MKYSTTQIKLGSRWPVNDMYSSVISRIKGAPKYKASGILKAPERNKVTGY